MMRDSGEVDLSLSKGKVCYKKVQRGKRCHAARNDDCNVIRWAARKTFDRVSLVGTMN